MALTRQSSSQLLSKLNQSHKNVDTEVYTTIGGTNYDLNVDKALLKKLHAAKRTDNVKIEHTNGGIVMTADTATFELLKAATLVYYRKKDSSEVTIEQSTDRGGNNIVQFTIRVNNKYTLNIYNTTSRILVNGKQQNIFINEDLDQIYEVCCSAKIDGQRINTDKLNQIFIEEIQKMQNVKIQEYSDNSRPKGVKPNAKNNEDISCIKCQKNCLTRSVLCSTSEHWIHYRCAGLTEPDIRKIESDSNCNFQCGLCTQVASIIRPTKNKNPKSKKINIPQKKIESKSIVQNLLSEETTKDTVICLVCDKEVIDEEDVCDVCNEIYHERCLADIEHSAICPACLGLGEQAAITSQNPTIDLVLDTQCHTLMKSKDTQTEVTMKNPDENGQQLRQKEVNLKKLENQLKIREKEINEKNGHTAKLEKYIQKLESQNEELNRTLKTYEKRIDMLETKVNSNSTHSLPTNKKDNIDHHSDDSKLLQSIHDRVTSFILKQVDKQLEILDQKTPETCIPSPDCEITKVTIATEKQGSNSSTEKYKNVQNIDNVPENELTQGARGCDDTQVIQHPTLGDVTVQKNKLHLALAGPSIFYKNHSKRQQLPTRRTDKPWHSRASNQTRPEKEIITNLPENQTERTTLTQNATNDEQCSPRTTVQSPKDKGKVPIDEQSGSPNSTQRTPDDSSFLDKERTLSPGTRLHR
ncbi:hypothetical protein MAR_019670 [Mya arenaria]|uniref:RING-type domain-containing protein n=1 Tax=Mya arenaria TaxID=6604 RepID=A0ABY7EAW3_MYAAR|nr:hypothetical protein MAR_019670 [Mya arenaria]